MDIKELATLTAAEMDDIYLRNVPAIILEQYATRLIATLEQQNAELVAALKLIATFRDSDGQCDNGYGPRHNALLALRKVKQP